MAEVLPELTKDATKAPLLDSLGNEVAPSVSFKAVNYTGHIPILLAGVKEQQSIIEAQNDALADVMDQLNALQDQVNGCCGGDAAPKNFGGEGNNEEQLQSPSKSGNVLEQNNPNPFRSQTAINYSLNEGGKVLLNVYDKSGKVVTTLTQGEQQSGNYRYEWDASGLPAGLYHYALYVDGELLIKKAIKLAD